MPWCIVCQALLSAGMSAQVCKEAEITEIAIDSREQAQSVYITKGSEGPIVSDKKKAEAAAA